MRRGPGSWLLCVMNCGLSVAEPLPKLPAWDLNLQLADGPLLYRWCGRPNKVVRAQISQTFPEVGSPSMRQCSRRCRG